MEEVSRFFLNTLSDFSGAAVDLTASLLKAPTWKPGMGLAIAAASLVILACVPEEYRAAARSVLLIAVCLAALAAIFTSFGI